jgi:hypothetical protein
LWLSNAQVQLRATNVLGISLFEFHVVPKGRLPLFINMRARLLQRSLASGSPARRFAAQLFDRFGNAGVKFSRQVVAPAIKQIERMAGQALVCSTPPYRGWRIDDQFNASRRSGIRVDLVFADRHDKPADRTILDDLELQTP